AQASTRENLGLTSQQYEQLINLLAKSFVGEGTSHAAFLAVIVQYFKPIFITLPNGQKSVVHHIGTIHLSEHIILHNVLHVFNFHFNLLSVNKLTKDMSTNVIFTPTSYLLQAPLMNKQLLIGHGVIGLYVIGKSSSIKLAVTGHVSSNLSISLINNVSYSQISPESWHCRLGRISFDQLQHVMNSSPPKSDFICTICSKA
ncbi:hypothetical protein V2J09_000077, partial [Rumex salicifolius]